MADLAIQEPPAPAAGADVKPGSQAYRNKLKKRKKKFLTNARGFGKSGNTGRGYRLEGDEWTYFMSIMEAIRRGFDELDDKREYFGLLDMACSKRFYNFCFHSPCPVSMAANVFEQTVDKEDKIAANQIACTILEHLLPFTEPAVVERFQRVFDTNEYRKHCSDDFASHVLQKLVEVSFLRAVGGLQQLPEDKDADAAAVEPEAKRRKPNATATAVPDEKQYNLSAAFEAEHRQACADYVRKISAFMLNNLEDFVWDTACHIMRTCVLCLSGVFVFKPRDFISTAGATTRRPISAEKVVPLAVPAEWSEVLVDYAKRLQGWPQFSELPYSERSSGLLQTLCVALNARHKTELKHLGKKLLNEAFCVDWTTEEKTAKTEDADSKAAIAEVKTETDDNVKTEPAEQLPKVFHFEPAIRLLEQLLTTAGPKLMTQIYARLFVGNLIALGTLKSGNFAVQKLLDNWTSNEEFEQIFDELAPGLEAMLRCGHTGVVNALAQACLRLATKQGAFVSALQTALHCGAPKERADRLAVLAMKLKPFDVEAAAKSNFVHLHGSLILQAMLAFNKPIKLVQSLLDTKPAELAELFSGPCGSHIVDAFIGSKFIGEKSREKFVRHMNGTFLELAISRHGSRAVEAMFETSGDNQRNRIVKELSEKINLLKGSPTGRLLNYKYRVETYILSPVQWKASFNREQKAEKLFKDILE